VTHDFFRLGHATRSTSLSYRERSGCRLENIVAQRPRVRDVSLRLGVRPHPVIHGWHKEYPGLCCKQTRREQVVSEAMRGSAHEVRRRGRHYDHICFAGEPDVIERVSGSENLSVDRTPCDCLECYRADELSGAASHHDVDLSTGLCKQTRQPH